MPPVTASLTGSPPGVHRESTARCSLLFSPFCAGDGLAPAPGAGAVRMGLDVAGVNHQPLEIRVIQHRFQQPGPLAPVPPAAEAAMGVLPVPVIRRQVTPRRPSPQYPTHRVHKQSIVPGRATPFACSSRQQRLQAFPYLVRKVVPSMRCCHTPTPLPHTLHCNVPSSPYLTTPLSGPYGHKASLFVWDLSMARK